MAFVHSKGTVVQINGTDMSGFATSITFTRELDTHDVTTFGKNSKVYSGGLRDGSAKMEGIYDNTAGTGPGPTLRSALNGAAAVPIVYRPEGTGTGKPTATVNALISSYEESSPVADMITWKAEAQFSGDVTDATQ